MSTTITQTCDNCGESRVLTDHRKPVYQLYHDGGWRVLGSGSLEATFCNHCIRELVHNTKKEKSNV